MDKKELQKKIWDLKRDANELFDRLNELENQVEELS